MGREGEAVYMSLQHVQSCPVKRPRLGRRSQGVATAGLKGGAGIGCGHNKRGEREKEEKGEDTTP